jgi:hypothetical protein
MTEGMKPKETKVGPLYIVFTVHLITIGRVHFYTNLCTQFYSIISFISPYTYFGVFKTPSSGGSQSLQA